MSQHRVVMVVTLVVATVSIGLFGDPFKAEASCVGPVLAVGDRVNDASPSGEGVLHRDEPFVVSGQWFFDGCDDTGTGTTAGCSGRPANVETGNTQRPTSGVALKLIQQGRSWTLDTQDASDQAQNYAITWQGNLPKEVKTGAATLKAGTALLKVTVR